MIKRIQMLTDDAEWAKPDKGYRVIKTYDVC